RPAACCRPAPPPRGRRPPRRDTTAGDGSYIGRQGTPVTMRVEWGKIREFARAIKDDDPLYFDEPRARAEAGGVWAPVTFLQTVRYWDEGRGSILPPFDLKRTLHGEQEYEFFKP